MTPSRRLFVSLSAHYAGVGYTTAAISLAQRMPAPFEPLVFLPQVAGALPDGLAHVRPFPSLMPAKLAYRPPMMAWARKRTWQSLLAAVRREGRGAIVWLWPGAPIELLHQLKAAGAIVVREMINTHEGTARRILDAEYSRLGILANHRLTDESVQREQDHLKLADYIVSPSDGVDESLREWGFSGERVIRSTFGWSPGDFAGTARADLEGQGIKAVFVGRVGIRKGIHLALAAWARAEIRGTLFVVGGEDADVAPLLAPYRDRPDVRFVPYTRDLASVYRAADFMFFPTLEEGAPLVCYQASGCGLPVLTSPMGRGRLVEHGTSGFIVDPHDEEGTVAHLRTLAGDADLRRSFGEQARQRAAKFDWSSAAAQRAEAFLERIG